MKWVTRQGAKVERVACPWLIRNFIDKEAEFLFVPPDKINEVVGRDGAIPFDAPGVELGHHKGKCSFETIVEKYKLADPALDMMAKIVHGADITAEIDIAPESAGLLAIAEGLQQICPDDHRKLELSFPIYDALYAYCKLALSRRP